MTKVEMQILVDQALYGKTWGCQIDALYGLAQELGVPSSKLLDLLEATKKVVTSK